MAKLFIGIDLGSTTVKAVVLNGQVLASALRPTGSNPRKAGEAVLEQVLEKTAGPVDKIVATGYGRVSFSADEIVSEITAHAKGGNLLFPDARTVIDIGGQDSKITRIDDQGRVLDFAMNDRCAAGTGRFIENTAKALEVSLEEFSQKSLAARSPARINSMCTVFAESEVISQIAQGTSIEDVSAGVHASVARRIKAMVDRVGVENQVIFTGGAAKSIAMRKALEETLKVKLTVPDEPQMVGALGAAAIGRDGY
ncbi:MAG: acyl-CoA dehydratase activase [Methanotrichaceae archaeon]|jgi:predicted CoA-substrate-specific enzyme activase